jgi:Uma2 family endonuclease
MLSLYWKEVHDALAIAYHPHHFSRTEYYAIAELLDPSLRYELLNGTIYAMSPAKPPHAGVVTFFSNRFRSLDAAKYLIRMQETLEIEPDSSPQPDVAIVTFRDDYYGASHPNGGDAALVIEVGDPERKPREKMSDYMRDGRIPRAWRIDIPERLVEVWGPSSVGAPLAILRGPDSFDFESVLFTVDEVFTTVLKR